MLDLPRSGTTIGRLLVAVALSAAAISPAGAQPAEPEQPVEPAPPEPPTPTPTPTPPPPPPLPPPPVEPDPLAPTTARPAGVDLRSIQIHGFVSQGAFVSTSNDYIGASSRGSLELFEVGLNVSTEVADRLRAGVQLFARNYGDIQDTAPRLDWAFLDYSWRRWLGVRAGLIKMPFGLYNEYADIDSARVAILMPQSVYPYRNRDALLSHRGFTLYGTHDLGAGGELDYAVWGGTLTIPGNALTLIGAELDAVDTKYVAGGRLFWAPPIEGLRLGVTGIRASIDFQLTLAAATTEQLKMMGLVPLDYDGSLVISQRPTTFTIASVEYTRGNWLVAAEYGRASKRQRSSLPALLPTFEVTSEQFYGLVTRRLSERIELGGYYSVKHVDIDDRLGRDKMRFPVRHYAFQRDAAATVRIDINPYWLWKLEAHVIDGTADLFEAGKPGTDRYWGMFLAKTTVTF